MRAFLFWRLQVMCLCTSRGDSKGFACKRNRGLPQVGESSLAKRALNQVKSKTIGSYQKKTGVSRRRLHARKASVKPSQKQNYRQHQKENRSKPQATPRSPSRRFILHSNFTHPLQHKLPQAPFFFYYLFNT